jgi:hypothetical protein
MGFDMNVMLVFINFLTADLFSLACRCPSLWLSSSYGKILIIFQRVSKMKLLIFLRGIKYNHFTSSFLSVSKKLGMQKSAK